MTALTAPGPLGELDWSRYADQLWAETSSERDAEWHEEGAA